MKRRGGRTFANLCADLYLLSLRDVPGEGPARGWRWEQMIAQRLLESGYPARAVAGGVSLFGVTPASGLRHQVDGQIDCTDALVIGEWKAYRGAVPKNEVLRFKAVTDDFFDEMSSRRPRLPILRLFGMAGDASPSLRWYAARHGVVLVERTRWPAPVLGNPHLGWPESSEPTQRDLERLRWLGRSMQQAYPEAPDGGYIVPPLPRREGIEAALATQNRLSETLWRLLDQESTEDSLGGAAGCAA